MFFGIALGTAAMDSPVRFARSGYAHEVTVPPWSLMTFSKIPPSMTPRLVTSLRNVPPAMVPWFVTLPLNVPPVRTALL